MIYRIQLAIFASCFLLGNVASTHAALAFDSTRIEVAAKPNMKSVTGTYVCKNTGRKAVTITRIRTTCGCTTASASRMSIQPGETAKIPVSMELRVSSGRQEKGVIIETKEAPFSYKLSIAALLPEYVKATPGSLLWVSGMPAITRTLNLTRVKPGATIGQPRITDPAFSARLTPTPTGWTLAVDLSDTTRQRFGSIFIPVTAGETTYELKILLSVIAPAPKSKNSFLDRLRGK